MQIRRGFTIVELLIVVVIIAILATVTVVAFNGIRIRAQAAQIGDEFKAIEKALVMYKHTLGLSTWPSDNDATYWTGTANPTIASIITAQPAFHNYLQSVPTAPIGTGNPYALDNDLDTYNGCSNASSGVNIYINNATASDTVLMQAVDDAIDDGNLTCGRVRFTGTSFHYNVALNQNG